MTEKLTTPTAAHLRMAEDAARLIVAVCFPAGYEIDAESFAAIVGIVQRAAAAALLAGEQQEQLALSLFRVEKARAEQAEASLAALRDERDAHERAAEEAVAAWHKENNARHDAEEERDALREALTTLVEKWRDPEFWKDRGCAMDSHDCADELDAALHATPETPPQEEDGVQDALEPKKPDGAVLVYREAADFAELVALHAAHREALAAIPFDSERILSTEEAVWDWVRRATGASPRSCPRERPVQEVVARCSHCNHHATIHRPEQKCEFCGEWEWIIAHVSADPPPATERPRS